MSQIKTFGSHLVDFSIIPDGGVFIDAGACQGNFIKDIRANVKNPHIIAIEPNKKNFYDLVETKPSLSLLFQCALVGSGEPKRMKFAAFDHLPEWGNVSGLYESRKPYYYDVNTMTIRDVLNYSGKSIIHHLKMDIEGCEHKVIKDLTVEDAKRIQQISMEVHNGLQGMMEHLEGIGYHAKFENGELYATTIG
jgi:FkbM family methyltransferase